MNIIEVENLVKKYGDKVAVNKVSFNIKKGELFSLLGVNGAGKTTTIKILTGVSKLTSGKVLINGKNIEKDINEIKSLLNVSPQETAIAQNLTVKENLYFIAGVYQIKNEDKVINKIVKDFDLE